MNANIRSSLSRGLALTAVTVLLTLGANTQAMARDHGGHRGHDRGHHYGHRHHRGHQHWTGHHRHHYKYPRHYYRGHRHNHYSGYPYGAYGLGLLTGILLDDHY